MKRSRLKFAAAIMGGLCAAAANAQELRQPASFQNAAMSYSYYQNEEAASPSDVPLATNASLDDAAQVGKDDCKDDAGCSSGCDPWRLFPEIGCGWTLQGFIAAGAVANADNPASGFNGPLTFPDQEGGMLNQLYLSFGRDTDTGGCGTDWGARVDFLYGSDFAFTQAAGLELTDTGVSHWNRAGNDYGIALPQAYVDVAYNDAILRMGHFYTIMGYEGVPATYSANFFYTHPYTHQYGEPFTHTGALGIWNYNERWVFYGGLVNGWDKLDAELDRLHFLGGATFTPDHERYTLTGTMITGQEDGIAPPILGTRTGYSLVLNYNVTDRLNYVLQHDNYWQDNAGGAGIDAEWYGLNQYLFYTVNDAWKLGARVEWFRDDDGYRLLAAPVRTGGLGAFGLAVPAAALAGNYYNFTLGANWKPRSNLTIRPEVRWDWSDGTVAAPFDDLTKDSQFTAAFDAILVF